MFSLKLLPFSEIVKRGGGRMREKEGGGGGGDGDAMRQRVQADLHTLVCLMCSTSSCGILKRVKRNRIAPTVGVL